MDITLNTGWGTRGAQLSGAQVQAFIKDQIRQLIAKDEAADAAFSTHNQKIASLEKAIDSLTPQLQASTDGCFVAYHRKSDNWPCAVPYWEWPEIEASGEVADGVLVQVDGQQPILVAPTENKLFWSKYVCEVDTAVGTDHKLAYGDFAGQTKTAAIMSVGAQVFGTDEATRGNYAASWCFAYDRSYEYHNPATDQTLVIGVQKNLWWLPSIAELVLIWKHKHAINICLSVIKDSAPLTDGWYWSSTEASSSTVWRLNMGSGAIQGNNNKTTYQHQTRPITSFYDPSIFNGEADKDDEVVISDDRFVRYGNCAVYLENAEAKPIAIEYPLTTEKIQSALISHKYTTAQINLINANYQLSLSEDCAPELKTMYQKQYVDWQSWQLKSGTVALGALSKKPQTV